MPNSPEREAIRAVVEEVIAERAQRWRFRRVLQRAVDVARSPRAVQWMKYGIAVWFGTALAHALGW